MGLSRLCGWAFDFVRKKHKENCEYLPIRQKYATLRNMITTLKKPVTTDINLPTKHKPIVTLHGDTRDLIYRLPDDVFQCVVTSPPYWGVRDYGVENQIGAEPDLHQYIKNLIEVFREVRRVLKSDGTFWLNIGNTYSSGGRKWRGADDKNKGRVMSYRPPTPPGLKKKDLIGVAWLLALECQKDGWYLRNDIIWNKPTLPARKRERQINSFTRIYFYVFKIRTLLF